MSNITPPSFSTLLALGKLYGLTAADRELIHRLIAQAALRLGQQRQSLTVIDCSCTFDATRVQEMIHLQQIDFSDTMETISVSRPFTAYQLKASTANLLSQRPTPLATPIIFISPLHLLYDDNIDLGEGLRLLNTLLADWTALRRYAPILLTLAPPPADLADRLPLFEKLLKGVDQLFTVQPPQPAKAQQLSLFSTANQNR